MTDHAWPIEYPAWIRQPDPWKKNPSHISWKRMLHNDTQAKRLRDERKFIQEESELDG